MNRHKAIQKQTRIGQVKRPSTISGPSPSCSDDEDGNLINFFLYLNTLSGMSRKLQPKVKRMTVRSASSSDGEDGRSAFD